VLKVEHAAPGNACKASTSTLCHHQLSSEFASRDLERVPGPILNHGNRPHRRWSGQLHIRNVSNGGLRFKFRGNGGPRVEQTDPCFQNPLEIFNIHWYAGANALRAYG
jgi:hypothetical protein